MSAETYFFLAKNGVNERNTNARITTKVLLYIGQNSEGIFTRENSLLEYTSILGFRFSAWDLK